MIRGYPDSSKRHFFKVNIVEIFFSIPLACILKVWKTTFTKLNGPLFEQKVPNLSQIGQKVLFMLFVMISTELQGLQR